jgi:hypothetical protein
MPPKADKMPTKAGKTPAPTTAAKAPRPADDEFLSQGPDAVLSALHRIIYRSTRQFARQFAPAIASISIALRELHDDAVTVDQEVSVRTYTSFNAANNGASFRRLEGEVHNLQPEEKAEFLRLVEHVCGEAADDDDDEDGQEKSAEIERLQARLTTSIADSNVIVESYEARINELEKQLKKTGTDDGSDGAKTSKLEKLRNIATDLEKRLTDSTDYVAKLERQVKRQDAEIEELEETASKLKAPRKSVDQKKAASNRRMALNDELEELAWYRRNSTKDPPAFGDSADNVDDTGAGIGARGADDAEDNTITSDHADNHESSVNSAKAPKKPEPRRPSTQKPPPTRPVFNPTPELNAKVDKLQYHRSTRQGSKAIEQPETKKKPKEKDQPVKPTQRKRGSGIFHYGYEMDYQAPKSINEGVDPEAIIQEARRKSRQANVKSNSDPETPQNTAAGTPAAGQNTDSPFGQAIAGRKQSKASTKTLKSTNDDANDADDDSDEDFKEPRKSISKKKRRAESSEEEEQPAASKKPRRDARILQPVMEEPEDDGKHARAFKGKGGVSSGPKAMLSRAQQSAKRKIAKDDSAESEGGMSDPICISSAEDTDSDTDDEY